MRACEWGLWSALRFPSLLAWLLMAPPTFRSHTEQTVLHSPGPARSRQGSRGDKAATSQPPPWPQARGMLGRLTGLSPMCSVNRGNYKARLREGKCSVKVAQGIRAAARTIYLLPTGPHKSLFSVLKAPEGNTQV